MSYFTILRPLNGIMSVISVWIGALLAGAAVIPAVPLLYGMLAVFLISGAGMVANDIYDIEIDRRNRPERPLPSGKISVRGAKAYAWTLFIIGNFLGFLLGNEALIVTLVATVLLVIYAAKLKKVLIAGHVIVSFLVALGFFFGSLIAGSLFASIWIGSLAFLANMGREIYKGIEDMLGDQKGRVSSLALRFGAIKAKWIGAGFTLAAVALSFAPYILGILNEVYLFFVILADIAFVSAAGAPVRYSSKLSKAGMLMALLAFILSAEQVLGLLV